MDEHTGPEQEDQTSALMRKPSDVEHVSDKEIRRAGYIFRYVIDKEKASEQFCKLDDWCIIYPYDTECGAGTWIAVSYETGYTGRASSQEEAYLELLLALGEAIKMNVKRAFHEPIGEIMDMDSRFVRPRRYKRLPKDIADETVALGRKLLKITTTADALGSRDLASTLAGYEVSEEESFDEAKSGEVQLASAR